jgi:hypothetical protein
MVFSNLKQGEGRQESSQGEVNGNASRDAGGDKWHCVECSTDYESQAADCGNAEVSPFGCLVKTCCQAYGRDEKDEAEVGCHLAPPFPVLPPLRENRKYGLQSFQKGGG